MASQNTAIGTAWEVAVRTMFREQGALCWKQHEQYNGRSRGVTRGSKGPPDLIAFTKHGHALLIECKSTRMKSLPWERLREHQRECLVAFREHHDRFHAFVFVLFDDRLRGNKRHRRAFAIPIRAWEIARLTSNRMSLAVDHAAVIGHELRYRPGRGWDRPQGDA